MTDTKSVNGRAVRLARAAALAGLALLVGRALGGAPFVSQVIRVEQPSAN